MKRKLLILVGIFILYQFELSMDDFLVRNTSSSKCGSLKNRFLKENTGYIKKSWKIIYIGDYKLMDQKTIKKSKNLDGLLIPVSSYEIPMDEVDIKTFEALDSFLGRDKNYVYYAGKRLRNIDIKTFGKVSWYGSYADPDIDCGPIYIWSFEDKNGYYNLEDIQTGKLKLEEWNIF